MINSIIKTQAHNRGSMMTQIAIYQSEATANGICLPLQTAKFINLWAYCTRNLWPDVNLIDDHSIEDGIPFIATKVAQALSYICKDGIRYGCIMNAKTQSDSYAFLLAQDNSA